MPMPLPPHHTKGTDGRDGISDRDAVTEKRGKMLWGGTCDRATDNKYPGCPAKMEDGGRLFTDYRPRCVLHSVTVTGPSVAQARSHDTRQFMIQHGDKLLRSGREHVEARTGCGPCSFPSTMLPEETVQSCDRRSCQLLATVPRQAAQPGPVVQSGIGRMYGHGNDIDIDVDILVYDE